MLEDLLKELGQRIGVPLALGADRTCMVGLGDGAPVHIVALDDPNVCVVVGSCGSVPEVGRTAYLRRLLEANFFHRDTGGAVLGWEPSIDEAMLVQRLRLDVIDGQGFADPITAFLAYQERWNRRAAEAIAA